MFKWQALAKSALAMHLVLLSAMVLVAVITQWRPVWAGVAGIVLAGSAATAQGMVLNARGFGALWWSQVVKWVLLGLGVIALVKIWSELPLPGFLVGVVMSQLIWARIGLTRAQGLRAGK
ncbi:MAG: hypothetical protein QNL18_05665 [Pseudomonadales bacterium]